MFLLRPPNPVCTVNTVVNRVNGRSSVLTACSHLPANGPSEQASREPIKPSGRKKPSHANNMWKVGGNRASAEAGRGLWSWQFPAFLKFPETETVYVLGTGGMRREEGRKRSGISRLLRWSGASRGALYFAQGKESHWKGMDPQMEAKSGISCLNRESSVGAASP